MAEQLAICVFFRSELAGINTAICRTEREIELVREYRARLIADVVTGKLDVRKAARALPSMSEETEPPGVALDLDEEELEEILPAEIGHE